ncbi:serine/threonine protein kinase, partial [Colletotrichum asianum]
WVADAVNATECNLKRLFRGDRVNVSGQKLSLWSQIGGLASAVAYLHESRTAHRDIKPSNILVYESHGTDQLELKLTDFGLAVDLSNALAWQEGSADVMSALNYNAPEIRLAFSKTSQNKNDLHSLPSPQQFLSNDIWKLGCVLTELAVFVTRGSVGVSRFRDSIITETANVSSDSFSDIRFDDGERIKAEVLASIDTLASDTPEVSQLQPILLKMLSEALSRPSARAVCEYLTQQTNEILLE